MADDIDVSHYNTGTATIANGSVNVVGQGTTWTSVRKGDMFGTHVGDGIRILEIIDETHLTLAHNWTGPSQTTAAYEIQRTPYDIGYLQRLEELILLLNSGNVEALAGLAGVDFIHAGMLGGYYKWPEDETKDSLEVLHRYGVMPALSCGFHPGLTDWVTKQVGNDYMANVGGAIHGHPDGTTAGAKAMRQSIDGQFGPEYFKAIDTWGSR